MLFLIGAGFIVHDSRSLALSEKMDLVLQFLTKSGLSWEKQCMLKVFTFRHRAPYMRWPIPKVPLRVNPECLVL